MEAIVVFLCLLGIVRTLIWFFEGLFKNRCNLCYRKRIARHTSSNWFGHHCKPDCLTRSFLNGKYDGKEVIYDYGEL